MIDEKFIDKWGPIDIEDYEYNHIKKLVDSDIKNIHAISKATLEALLNWKASRTKGKLNWNNFEEYEKTFKVILELPKENKLEKLTELAGFGVSISSAILHFIYPSEFPIIDIRAVETLQATGYIDKNKSIYSIRDTIKGYYFYRSVILEIAKTCRKSLREIDKALFKYHKIKLSKFNQSL